ncbi:MAG: TerB family tellurite resistance protein [Bacteroidales bacterium]|nr:TerB family tellurite resistance protein [Bacteroidales bacterium]
MRNTVNKNMTLSGLQLSALLKMGLAMVHADGKVTDEETKALSMELLKFGVAPNELPHLLSNATSMSAEHSLIIVAGLDAEQKKYATGYLAMLMACDGIDDSEIKLWRMISTLCGFPTMTIEEAINFWENN